MIHELRIKDIENEAHSSAALEIVFEEFDSLNDLSSVEAGVCRKASDKPKPVAAQKH